MISREVDRDVARCASAHQGLLASLANITEVQVRQPSNLPGWSVAHVLTHLARNADSHVRMLDGANRGEVLTQYSGGMQSRNDDIEAGIGRSADELVADVRSTIYRLEAAWASSTEVGWAGHGIALMGEVPMSDLVYRRWRETEIHRADLGLGFGINDWPSEFVRLDLGRMTAQWASRKPMGLTDLPTAALELPPAARLAWLWGRLDVPGLPAAGIS